MLSALKDISGSPSFTGGSAAPSGAYGGTASGVAGGGDIITGGSMKMPNIFWIGAGLLAGVLIYRMVAKKK